MKKYNKKIAKKFFDNRGLEAACFFRVLFFQKRGENDGKKKESGGGRCSQSYKD